MYDSETGNSNDHKLREKTQPDLKIEFPADSLHFNAINFNRRPSRKRVIGEEILSFFSLAQLNSIGCNHVVAFVNANEKKFNCSSVSHSHSSGRLV